MLVSCRQSVRGLCRSAYINKRQNKKKIAVRAHNEEDVRGPAERRKRDRWVQLSSWTRAQMLVSNTRPVPSAIFSRDARIRLGESVCFRLSELTLPCGCVRSHGAPYRAVKLRALWLPPRAGGVKVLVLVLSVHVPRSLYFCAFYPLFQGWGLKKGRPVIYSQPSQWSSWAMWPFSEGLHWKKNAQALYFKADHIRWRFSF